MRTFLSCFLCTLMLISTPPTQTQLRSCALLEAAFSMLEEGNHFVERYNRETDSLLEVRYPLGLPYFFSGHREDLLMKPHLTMQPSGYFKPDRMYLYGFDCKGFVDWVCDQAGVDEPGDAISDLLSADSEQTTLLKRFAPEEIASQMTVGDMLAVRHGSRHIMMYIGTLEDYGYTARETGLEERFMRYPLVVHCGYDPFYYDRYKQALEPIRPRCYPPDGGVTVSILGMSGELATHHRTDFGGKMFDYFIIDGQPLSVFDIYDCTRVVWYRHAELE